MHKEIESKRAMAVLRIQKKEDFIQVVRSRAYPKRKRESSLYRRRIIKKTGKKVGVANNLVAQHLEADNKGYSNKL